MEEEVVTDASTVNGRACSRWACAWARCDRPAAALLELGINEVHSILLCVGAVPTARRQLLKLKRGGGCYCCSEAKSKRSTIQGDAETHVTVPPSRLILSSLLIHLGQTIVTLLPVPAPVPSHQCFRKTTNHSVPGRGPEQPSASCPAVAGAGAGAGPGKKCPRAVRLGSSQPGAPRWRPLHPPP